MTPIQMAARAASRRMNAACAGEATHSHFQSTVRPKRGPVRHNVTRHNLTTDTAGAGGRRDWESQALGMGPSFAFATATGALTACTATLATNSGAAFPTSGNALKGQIIVVSANSSGAGTTVYGVILSNTATAITVDQWYLGGSTTGGVATTPNATGNYIILPGNNPASWMALTSDGTAPTASDTSLASEATTNGFARAVGTYSHTTNTSTYALTHTFTASGSLTVNNEAIGGSAIVSAGSIMPFKSAEPTPPALLSGDTLAQTATVTIG